MDVSACAAGSGSVLNATQLRKCMQKNEAHGTGGLLHAITVLCTRWAREEAPLEIAPWIAGAPLTILRKPNGDVRPIAVGETFTQTGGVNLDPKVLRGHQSVLGDALTRICNAQQSRDSDTFDSKPCGGAWHKQQHWCDESEF